MDGERQRARRVFLEVVDLPEEAREAALARACGGDEALRAGVEALLRAEREMGTLPAEPPTVRTASPGASPGAFPSSAPPQELPGMRIGPYKLLQRIGEGGFGSVFMAEQEKPIARKVALKVIKLGMDTRQVIARFAAERQALAILDHPNIAKVLDAGATDAGRPFFVMELVRGEPITAYCDKHNRSIRERLDLFAEVCAAVQHAHTKGIIHRDLKPGNVLVSTQDGRPRAKIIDFGIAKATAGKLTEMTLFTEHRQLIGTPEYMSPEQAEGSLDIDTRTDVYSLGVLLYELLTGSTPFDSKSLRSAAYAEIQRIIREVDPPRPSTRLSQNTESLDSVAARRRTEPRKLGTIVRGELDWIVMKALEKDRNRRYETADGLALDIRRYLAGEAVGAAPPGAAYRARKFIRRHRAVVSAGGAVAVALLVGVVAFAWQARVAGDQRDRAVKAEAEARTRADELEKVSDFQAGMLGQVDPAAAGRYLSEDVTARFESALAEAGVPEAERERRVETFRGEWNRVNVTDAARELIDRTILRPSVDAVETRFADQPVVAARLRQTLADLYRRLGLYDAALPLQTEALEARRRDLGEERLETLVSISHMGLLLMDRGKLDEAEPYFREAVERNPRILGEDHPETMDAFTNLGVLLESEGRLDEAEPQFRKALELRRRVFGDEDPETPIAIGNLGYLLESQGKQAEAEPLYREALEKSRRLRGEEDPFTLASLVNLGALLHAEGRLDEAEPYYREAIETSRRALGEEHPSTLRAIANMGVLLKYQGRLAEAEPYYRETLEKRRRVLGEEHPSTLVSINNLGGLLMAEGKPAEAEPYYREALEKKRRVLGNEHPSTLKSILALGELLEGEGKHAEAAGLLAPAMEGARAAFTGDNQTQVARMSMTLGEARAGLGAFIAAEDEQLEAHGILAGIATPPAEDLRKCADALAALYASWEKAEPDKGHAAKAVEWKEKRGAIE